MRSKISVFGSTICCFIVFLLTLVACGAAPAARETAVVVETVVGQEAVVGETLVPPTDTPEPVNNAESPLAAVSILPFNYEVEDAGDGWNVGTVDLAFVSTADHPIPAQVIGFNLASIHVETLEGKTYPASLFVTSDAPGAYSSAQGVNPIVVGRAQTTFLGNGYEVNPNGLPLPPYLPFSMVLAKRVDPISGDPTMYYTLDFDRIRYLVQFRFASAAHPTRLIMPSDNAEYQIDLSAPGASSGELTPISFTPRSLQDLSNYLSQNNQDAQVSFGECYQDDANDPHDYFLPFTMQNKNQLDETRLDYNYAIWYSNGVYLTSIVQEGGSFLVAGPGQTVEGKIKMLNWGIPQILVIYDGDKVDYYAVGCGSPKTGSLTPE